MKLLFFLKMISWILQMIFKILWYLIGLLFFLARDITSKSRRMLSHIILNIYFKQSVYLIKNFKQFRAIDSVTIWTLIKHDTHKSMSFISIALFNKSVIYLLVKIIEIILIYYSCLKSKTLTLMGLIFLSYLNSLW